MGTKEILAAIDTKIQDRNLLKHPFYQAWTKGELSMGALRDYAQQYYKHVAAFPTYISAVHAHTEDQEIRRHLLENLSDEEAGRPNHPELWLQFAEHLGVQKDAPKNATVQPETQNLIDTFRKICSTGTVAQGVAALYAYESQIPPICESKIEGLQKFYGMTNPAAYEYFTVHIEADKEHSAVERKMLSSLLESDKQNGESTLEAVDQTLDALWGILSGVCERHGISCH